MLNKIVITREVLKDLEMGGILHVHNWTFQYNVRNDKIEVSSTSNARGRKIYKFDMVEQVIFLFNSYYFKHAFSLESRFDRALKESGYKLYIKRDDGRPEVKFRKTNKKGDELK